MGLKTSIYQHQCDPNNIHFKKANIYEHVDPGAASSSGGHATKSASMDAIASSST